MEPITPDPEQCIILFALKHVEGQRAGNGQRLFQPGRDGGARRDTERHHASARLQVDREHRGLGERKQGLISVIASVSVVAAPHWRESSALPQSTTSASKSNSAVPS